ncbi:MAG TPA: hypothetical protein VIF62_39060 [Labilithrix sp.]
MVRLLAALVLAFVPLHAPACSSSCAGISTGGLLVRVRDARTGAPLCDATVVATSGASHQRIAPNPDLCAFSWAGPTGLSLDVSRPGYSPKHLDGVAVPWGDACAGDQDDGPKGNDVTVDLEPDPNGTTGVVGDAGR